MRPDNRLLPRLDRQAENMRHPAAFAICVASADQVIRLTGSPDLVGFTFSEDCSRMRYYLTSVFYKLGVEPLVFAGPDCTGPGPPLDLRIQRMRSAPLFIPRGPLMLQIADACAYGVRRAYAGLSAGLEHFRTIFGFEFPFPSLVRSLGRTCLLPKTPGRLSVVNDPNGLMEMKFGIKAGQSVPMLNP